MNKTRNLQSTPQAPTFVQIDSACQRFEDELRSGKNAKIEDYLDGWDEPERSKLLYELLSLEVDHRRERGEQPSRQEHATRFADSRHVVDEVFQRPANPRSQTQAARTLTDTLVMNSELADLRYHAEGGLGIVYAAEDRLLKRNMAIKFIQDRVAEDPDSRARFQLEAEVTSRLEHPGVVPVHGLGETADGRLFYAMRFIHGETLDTAIDQFHHCQDGPVIGGDRDVQFRELLGRFVAVCKTIAYAHNRGIVHRDIKPANIMLGRYGQTIVVDWGLALPVGRRGVFKESDERTLMPSSGSESNRVAAGTPAFMSPEQAAGSLDLSPASDIYSLGATLYRILTGDAPFHGNDVLNRVTRGEFQPPRVANREVSRALEAICLKAMSLRPQDRYPTALELAKDVENYLADVPVTAYSEPLTRKLARWARRHRNWAQGVLGVFVLMTVAGVLAAAWLGRQAQRESNLRAAAVSAQHSEHELRKQGLQVSAQFAARMIANQIDIRWRVMEKEAADTRLHDLLRAVNSDPAQESNWLPLQQWLDERSEHRYSDLPTRAWFVQSIDGTQVARSPSIEEDGQRFESIGANYAFRDYFHAKGRDYYHDRDIPQRPLTSVHNSTAMESTNHGDLSVVFSVPILVEGSDEPLGVLGMSIELGRFADLRIRLPAKQKVLLVETRTYYLQRTYPEDREERGEGLVLHHEDLRGLKLQSTLPHVSDRIVQYMRQATEQAASSAAADSPGNLLPDSYRDPLAHDGSRHWLAAFAPVLTVSRPIDQQHTGWFVIVQQEQEIERVESGR
jgi:tRNA A-37 threonylcarbamoyl transferase component Bud32